MRFSIANFFKIKYNWKMEQSEVISVRISLDQNQAFLTVHPEAVNLKLTIDRLKEILKEKRVVFGLKEDVLARIVETHKTRPVSPNLMVAEGIKPSPGEPPSVTYKFKSASSKPGENKAGKTDYRDLSTIIKVTKGQVLAVKKSLKPPANGITVTGRDVELPPIADIPLTAGENVITMQEGDQQLFFADVDGALRHAGHTLSVSSSIKIDGNLDFKVGNIRFSGGAVIRGDVKPDFVVEAGEKISIGGCAIACRIAAGKDLEVGEGIVGKNRGTAEAKGNITASYVEYAVLTSEQNIIIKNGVSGSTISCDGFISVENPNARTVSSTLKAAKGITVSNVGSKVDQKTRLVTGLIPKYEKEYFKIKDAVDAKIAELKIIEKRYGKEALEKKSFTMITSRRMKLDIEKWDLLKEEIAYSGELLKKAEPLIYNYDAVITIKGRLFPGVYLRIGKCDLTPARAYHNVKIHYSKDSGKLEIT
jgi:uncharacterized protein (DUF342 family)